MVKSPVGEDGIAYCDDCGYAANYEKCECLPVEVEQIEGDFPMEKISTPAAHTIDELVDSLGMKAYNFAKTIIYKADDKYIAAMVRGDREVNEVKLKNLVGCTDDLELAEPAIVREITNAQVGFAGPVNLGIEVYADKEVAMMKNFVVGANETDMHYKNVNIGRDFEPDVVADIRVVETGDKCPKCGGTIKSEQGIEVGHIFKLGTKYSEALGLKYLDESGEQKTVIMGCYGIGVTRCLAAAVEQMHDDNGIIWPVSIAPYQAIIVTANFKDDAQVAISEKLYKEFLDAGVEVLLDDRKERAGVKFKDADLIGIPVRIVVSKKAGDGVLEYKERKMENAVEISVDEALSKVQSFIKENM